MASVGIDRPAVQRGGDVADEERLDQARVSGLPEPQAEGEEERLALTLPDPGFQDALVLLGQGRLDLAAGHGDAVHHIGPLLEDRALLEIPAQPDREDHEPEAQQERQAPAPLDQLLVAEGGEQDRPQPRRGQRTGVGAERHQRRDQAAALRGGVLGEHDGRPGDLGSRRRSPGRAAGRPAGSGRGCRSSRRSAALRSVWSTHPSAGWSGTGPSCVRSGRPSGRSRRRRRAGRRIRRRRSPWRRSARSPG